MIALSRLPRSSYSAFVGAQSFDLHQVPGLGFRIARANRGAIDISWRARPRRTLPRPSLGAVLLHHGNREQRSGPRNEPGPAVAPRRKYHLDRTSKYHGNPGPSSVEDKFVRPITR
jgi:hypothetical protein